MSTSAIQWPVKSRELQNHHFDSTIWNDFAFRDDDIIISTYCKAGTTWVQQMIAQMLFGGDPDLHVADMSPWLDLRIPPKAVKLPVVEAQTHRRFLKTHLPVDALVFSPKAKYLYIGRDGRDVVWSLHNHHRNANTLWYEALNDTPGRIGPPIDPPPASRRDYFLAWLDGDGYPFWSFWDNVRSWWAIRSLPNVMMIHYAALKADMPGEMSRIADFLGIDIDPARWETILEYCRFDWMKKHASKAVPLSGAFWDGGAGTFIHKGTNGVWRDELTPADVERYEQRAVSELGRDCARWLASGDMPA
ncbi:MAG: sulfotransferase domain-containing protein [Phycisphaerales bacterium]|nr:sulfotransferase domain-containing protein [Phycisphaerales bacterium]